MTGKAFAAGVRALSQVLVLVLASLPGVRLNLDPPRLVGVVAIVLLGSASFCCLSIVLAEPVLSRERTMGIGQAITMPLFFASNALYPMSLMPRWHQVVNHVNPLSYQVEALRGLLLAFRHACRWISLSSQVRPRQPSRCRQPCSAGWPGSRPHTAVTGAGYPVHTMPAGVDARNAPGPSG